MADPNRALDADALMEWAGRLIKQAKGIDLLVTDEPGSLSLAATSAPQVLGVLRDAVDLLISIQDIYEFVAPDDADEEVEETPPVRADERGVSLFSLDDIGALISSEIAAQEIGNLAFVASAQLRTAIERLEAAITEANPLSMVSVGDAALRQFSRGLLPIESAIYEFEGKVPPIRVWGDLQTSLQTRRLYGDLRRRFLSIAEPDDVHLEERLWEMGRELANLRTADIYTQLRIDDRLQIRGLLRRISEWLADEERKPIDGRRLWQDLTTFANLLSQVNNRQELQEHDSRIVAQAYQTLFRRPPFPSEIPMAILARFHAVLGRDDELDALIFGADDASIEQWESTLRRLLVTLGHPEL